MDQRRVWETISDSFDRSRDRTWPHVAAFLDALPRGRVLDLMCGNGRHSRVAQVAGHAVVALDWSRPFARMVQERGHGDAIVGDATRLPLRDACMDGCIYVAGLHGIPDPAGRLASLQELRRVLRPGGRAQVTVWSRDAPRFREQGPPGPLDVVIPWRSDGHDAQRTCHLYTPDALEANCRAAGLAVEALEAVSVVSKDPDNLVATLRKD